MTWGLLKQNLPWALGQRAIAGSGADMGLSRKIGVLLNINVITLGIKSLNRESVMIMMDNLQLVNDAIHHVKNQIAVEQFD